MSASATLSRRLTIPAEKHDARETLRVVRPFWLRGDAAPAPPVLLAYEGDGFLDDFLARRAPTLLPWRDWAEPPSEMLDAAGARRYPASIARAPAGLPTGPELDPDGVPSGTPPWLRKLYLPLHNRFAILAFDVVCESAYYPRLARGRVQEAGVVLRRLVADATRVRWEDWIRGEGTRGAWVERTLPGMPDPASLDSTKLTLLPPEGEAARHCTLYGLLTLTSADEQAPEVATPTAAVLAARARAAIATAFAVTPPAVRIAASLRTLLDLTVIPAARTAPSASEAASARALALAAIAMIVPMTAGPSDADAVVPTVEQLWTTLGIRGHVPPGTPPAIAADMIARPDYWMARAAQVLAVGTDAMLAGGGAGALGANADSALLAAAMIRLRRFRAALAAHLLGQIGGNAAQARAQYAAIEGGVPVATAGSLSADIEAALGLDDVRDPPEDAPPWGPLNRNPGGSDRALRAHRAGLAIENAFAALEAATGGAGSAWEDESEAQVAAAAARIGAATGIGTLTALRARGLELREQPSKGLIALPGLRPDAIAIGNAVATRYTADAVLAGREARDQARVPRPRYDAHHIFVAQAWVRVAGRTACEREQVLWAPPSEPFAIADPTDLLGQRPATIQMPDIPKLLRDIPRLARARARPFAGFAAPADSSYITGEEAEDTRRAWGIGFICSFGIPVITIVAYILFSITLSILLLIPGFAWMLLLKFCIPIPKRQS